MPVDGMVGKMLYIDPLIAETLKEIAGVYNCSESSIMRKALHNYIGLYQDLMKHNKEYKSKSQMVLGD